MPDEIPPRTSSLDDSVYLERLTKAIFQVGFGRQIVDEKWPSYRKAFGDFDVATVAGYSRSDVERLVRDRRIICNRLKVEATIHNAQVMRDLIEEHGSFYGFFLSLDELDAADRGAELSRRFMNLGSKGVGLFLQSVAGETLTGEDRGE